MTETPVIPVDRILVVHERYQQAGGEDGVFEAQVRLLRARGHAVETLEIDNDAIAERRGPLGALRLARDTVWSPEGQARVREAIERFRPTILHAHNTFPLLSPAIHPAAHALGVATVQTLHNFRLVCPAATLFRDGHPCHDCIGKPVAWPGVLHACYRESRPASAAIAAMDLVHRARHTWTRDLDQIIVLAAFTVPFFRQGGIREDRVSVVPNFVTDEGHVDASGADGYLFVGRLTEDKGVRTLLEAWRRVPPGLTLTIAGTGPLEGEVADAAAAMPSVRYVGRLDRAGVARALAAARALIVPSHWYENCPLTVLEAFAAGRAVIASGHGGLAELVDDGVTGLHVAPADPVSLAAAIDAAEADPGRLVAYGRAARARYDERFSEARGYERLLAAYRRALARHEGHRRGSVSAS